MKMPKVLVFTDFDGTATGREGSLTVFSEFFTSLLDTSTGATPNYKKTSMKSSAEVQAAFKAKFGDYNADFDYKQTDADLLMSPAAVAFFHEGLKNPDLQITFVTKNRRDYIQELFRYQGFSDEEISKLIILDEKDKFTHVSESLQNPEYSDATDIFILDDSKSDFNAMVQAAKVFTGNHHEFNNSVGKFDWDNYLNEIRILAPLPNAPDSKTSIPEPEQIQPKDSRLTQIDDALSQLKIKIDGCDFKNYPDAQAVANKLHEDLSTARDTYANNLGAGHETDANILFISTCKTVIDEAKPILEKDLSWGEYLKNLLKTMVNAVIRQFHPNSLFSYARSPSLKAVEDAQQVFIPPGSSPTSL